MHHFFLVPHFLITSTGPHAGLMHNWWNFWNQLKLMQSWSYKIKYQSIKSLVSIFIFALIFRYMAICRPLTVPRRLSKMARASWALVAIWISSVIFSLPWLYYNKVIAKSCQSPNKHTPTHCYYSYTSYTLFVKKVHLEDPALDRRAPCKVT